MENIRNAKFDPLFAGPISLQRLNRLLPKGVDYVLKLRGDRGSNYRQADLFFKSKGRTGAGDRLVLQQLMRYCSILVDMRK